MNKCHCSQYEAFPADLTEDDLETGDYETATTGCTAHTSRTFAPGHDAKLKSALIRWETAGMEISYFDGGVRTYSDAMTIASRHGFGHMVAQGIAKAQERAEAKAAKKAGKQAPRHEGNAARQDREAKSLAEQVAAEEAKHAAEQAASRPAPEWEDDEAAVDLTGRPEVMAKLGRWEYKGVVADDGTLHYLARDGHTRKTAPAGKFTIIREL